MLRPGIEYFGAADDRAALAFAEGNSPDAPPLLRADDVTPAALAIFGALLTARPIAELSVPPELEELDLELRDDSVVRVLRLPRGVSAALARADREQLEALAARSLVYLPPGADVEVVADFLDELGATARAGGIYARVIEPFPPPRSVAGHPGRARRLLSYGGLLLAGGLAVTAFILVPLVPGTLLPLLVPAAALTSLSIQAITRDRADARLEAVAEERDGAVVTTIRGGPDVEERLSRLASAVLGSGLPAGRPRAPRLHLMADPAGLTVRFDAMRGVTFPAPSVIAVAPHGPGQSRLSFALRVSDDEAELWDVDVVDSQGAAAGDADLASIAATFASILGARLG